MRLRLIACAVMLAALPASAQEGDRRINLIHGHPIYHASENEAGVTMGLSITPGDAQAAPLMALCNELRDAAGLGDEHGDGLRLQALFVVPRKGMTVEGYYLPSDGTFEGSALVAGKSISRTSLDRIVAQAGIPPSVLDETSVEHEISCRPDEPLWTIAWHDVGPIGGEEPEAVIERARNRFLAIHKSVVKRAMDTQWSQADISAAYGTEENFVYIDRMPNVQGEPVSIHSRKDPRSGLFVVKKIYRARIVHDEFLIHVLEVNCATEKNAIELPGPYIVAFQSLPKNPKNYSIMERHASFDEVCVRDLQSKIRLYRNMNARHMVELTHRFLPICPVV